MSATAGSIEAAAAVKQGSLRRNRRWALIWSYVFLVMFAVFFLLPPVYMLIMGLKTSSEIAAMTNPWWVFNPTLENFKALLTSKTYLTFFRNSAVICSGGGGDHHADRGARGVRAGADEVLGLEPRSRPACS